MTRRSKIWWVAAAVFVVINVAGAGYAIALRETQHALTHLGLLVGGYLVWQLLPRGRSRDITRAQTDARVEYLQQSVDALALEIERIGEAQRFSDKLRAEQAQITPPKQDQPPTS